ncbi:MAG: PAS domain S-box protein [Desulfomonile sp.]|nr:PAS domain S-box protein [Desulfomonile sp.]
MKQEQQLKELDDLRARIAELESIVSEMRDTRSRYEAVVQAFDGLIYICSADYKIEFMNSRFIERTGRNPIGEDCYRALHDLDEICPWCVNKRVFAGETVRWEFQNPKDRRWYYIVNTPIRNSDGTLSKMAMIQDVTERKLSEIALQESENRYRQLVERANDIIYRTDSNGCFTFVNPIAMRLSGYSEDELIGLSYLEVVHPDHRAEAARFYGIQFVKKLVNTYYEVPLLTKGGQTVWVGQHVQLMLVDDTPAGFQAIARDITDRKIAEQQLEQERLRFRALAEQAPYAIVMVSATGRFLYVNPKFEEMFGYSFSEIPMGRDWFRKAFPDQEYRRKAVAAWREDLSPSRTGEQRPRVFTVTCKDGREKIVHFHPVQLPTGEHLITCEDITDRVHAEKALSEHASILENLLDKAADGICVYHNIEEFPYVRFTHWNPRMSEITGYAMEEINKSGWYQTMYPDPENRARAVERMARLRKGDDIRAEESVITSRNGTLVPLSISASIIKDEHGKVHVLAIMQDVTARKKDEAALRDSEERYRVLVEESFDGIFVQMGTKIVFANSRLYEMLGYSKPELIGKNHWEIYHPDYHDLTRSRAQARMRGEAAPPRYEVRLQRKDGSSFEGEINAKSVTVEGQPGIQVWIKDITERKKAEESLRESEKRYRELFDNSADLIYTHDLEGNYTSVNKAVERLLGYTPEEFMKLNFRHIVDPDSLKLTEENFRRKINGYVDRTGPYEVLVRAKDGHRLWLEVNSRIILHEGTLVGIHGTARDVSDRKMAQEQLKKLFAAVEQAGETIVVTDPMGTIEYVNPSFEATTGYTAEEVVGQNLRILKSGKHSRAFYQEMWETISSGTVWRGRLTNRKKDGTLFEETVTISPIKDEAGRIVNYVGVKRDVTSEVMLQKQLLQAQKMEAVGTLAGGIAHDFNNLLQAVLGYSDLLLMEKGPGDPDLAKLQAIKQAAQDGAELVSRILSFTRKGESNLRPMNLNDEIRRVAKLLRRTLPRMVRIDLALAEDLRIIEADPAQIEQVLLNLGVNAHHAMPDGGQLLIETQNVSLSDQYVSMHLGAKPGKYVLLIVSDTGVGMEPEVLDRVFEPFFTTKVNGEGTGLGLAIVHGIVAQHQGYIRCYSEPGKGTSFKIYFPVSAGEPLPDLALTRGMPALGTETILLVDDDDRIRELGKQVIEMGGYQVITARSGEDALEIYAGRRGEISLIVLDLIMPGMGGYRCLQKLLRIDPDVRVLLASGYSQNGLTIGEKETGARGFIRKPYDAKDILIAVRKVLDKGYL